MITKATLNHVTEITNLVNSAYRGETSKKGWTTEANILEGTRITETELSETLSDANNTILIYQENETIIGTVLLINKKTDSTIAVKFLLNHICGQVRSDDLNDRFFNLSLKDPQYRKFWIEQSLNIFLNGVKNESGRIIH